MNNTPFSIVHTQSLENYGDTVSYYKFKGGSTYLVSGANCLATAVAMVMAEQAKMGNKVPNFPCHWNEFETEEQAIMSLDEWQREYLRRLDASGW